MSSVPSQESVEQTKRQIRTLVQEISDMSKGDAAPAEFYPSVLQRIVQALVANGGAIWLVEAMHPGSEGSPGEAVPASTVYATM